MNGLSASYLKVGCVVGAAILGGAVGVIIYHKRTQRGLRNSAATYGTRASILVLECMVEYFSVVTRCSDCDVHRDWFNFQ